jgi:polysaccharide deacetylase family protein (PEP-CTERM system associated)
VPLTITLDLEDHTPGAQAPRYGVPTRRLLDWLGEHGVRATVFVVGELAERSSSVVAEIAQGGHEIGVHGLRHIALEDVGEAGAIAELRRAREVVEAAAGQPASGFRAPIFSLTRRTPWAPEALLEAGYTWSSSVLPARSPLHGIAGAPTTPFRWENGLVELPCPVAGPGRAQVPFLGGVYLRYLPQPFIRAACRRLGDDVVAWSYVHPYDLDPDEPFHVLPHAGWLTSQILHARRRGTLDRLASAARAAGGFGPPLGEVAAALQARELPTMAL